LPTRTRSTLFTCLLLTLTFAASGRPGIGAAAACDTPVMRIGSGADSTAATERPSVSGDGRFVAFDTSAADFDGDSTRDVFVHDRATCSVQKVSLSFSGGASSSSSQNATISDDGLLVAFESFASNLVPNDDNGSSDIFVRNHTTGPTILVSVDSNEVQPVSGSSTNAVISADGRFVAFISSATTLVPGDTNNEADVFLRDLLNGTTERVSISSTGSQGDSPSSTGVSNPALSADGRFVAFLSSMNTLVTDDFNNTTDVFVRDRLTGTTTRASVTSAGVELTFTTLGDVAITADGRYVFFVSRFSGGNYVPGDVTCDGIFIRDLQANTTSCPALDPTNASSSMNAESVAISADGRYVSFASSATHYVAGDTGFSDDVFIHDRVTGAIRRVTSNGFGIPSNSTSMSERVRMSSDGKIVAFTSSATNLVPADPNGTTTDAFVTAWAEISHQPNIDVMRNGSFAAGLQNWRTFATPEMGYIVTDTTGGVLQFYRVPPPEGTTNQAVVFQPTFAQFLPHAPVEASFQLGNTSTVRKRISVLLHDEDFSDLSVCTFWLPPSSPRQTYVMRAHTTESWSNATISFYAATAGSDGGHYQIDDVRLQYVPQLDDDVTDCIDPNAPEPPGGAEGTNLIQNGSFGSGALAPWTTFGTITSQITDAVFEFFRPAGQPAGVVLQATGQPLNAGEIVTATMYLGNSSAVRKRVTVLLHDQDFSDLSACTFWLPPGQLLSPYRMRTFTSEAWSNAALSVYPSTVGTDAWIRLDDVTLQQTPGSLALGTECVEPGANAFVLDQRQMTTDALRVPAGGGALPTGGDAQPTRVIHSGAAVWMFPGDEADVVWQTIVDLNDGLRAVLSFEALLPEGAAGAVQVSEDGVTWVTVLEIPAASEWLAMSTELSSRGVLHVRIVGNAQTGHRTLELRDVAFSVR
jgi:hypothetical protein